MNKKNQNKRKKESKTKQQQQQKTLVQIHSLSLREVLPELIAKATCKRTQQQLPTLLGQQCWEWSCCVRVGSSVQTDVATPNNTQQHLITRNRVCNGTQHEASNNVGSCCVLLKLSLTVLIPEIL